MSVDGRINIDTAVEEVGLDAGAPVGKQDAEGSDGDRPRSRRTLWMLGGIIVVATAAAIAFLVMAEDGNGAATDTVALSFEPVTQTDLVQLDSFDGTLGTESGDPVASPSPGTVTATAEVGVMVEQGDALLTVDNQPVVLLYGELPAYRALAATEDTLQVNGNKSGVVTDVVIAGTSIEQGDVLYRVNGDPVVVMYGNVPAYRTLRDLSDDMEGQDVLQLEEALVAMGYDPDGLASVDETFTDYTETKWRDGKRISAWKQME